MDLLESIGAAKGIVAAIGSVVGSVLAVLVYLSQRDKRAAVRLAFRAVVDSLSSESEAQRLGGAILLRRFFDPKTELGRAYAREAVDVIAALLRSVPTGNLQKLLADGLLYAPSLQAVDLQRTNLQNAYLGRKGDASVPNLARADFFRADLSSASLKGADLSNAVFYQARLHNTILKGADLSNASFFEADLLGADFTGARLSQASFQGARNIPAALLAHLDEQGSYRGPEACPKVGRTSAANRPKVFVSRPGTVNTRQREFLQGVRSVLADEGVDVVTVERKDYPNVGAVSEVRRVLSGCSGVLVVGFRQLEVSSGVWRSGTEEAREVHDIALPTTWNHVEAGMAAMVGLPMLFLREHGVVGGLFELSDVGHFVADINLSKPNHDEIRRIVSLWCHSVREAPIASSVVAAAGSTQSA